MPTGTSRRRSRSTCSAPSSPTSFGRGGEPRTRGLAVVDWQGLSADERKGSRRSAWSPPSATSSYPRPFLRRRHSRRESTRRSRTVRRRTGAAQAGDGQALPRLPRRLGASHHLDRRRLDSRGGARRTRQLYAGEDHVAGQILETPGAKRTKTRSAIKAQIKKLESRWTALVKELEGETDRGRRGEAARRRSARAEGEIERLKSLVSGSPATHVRRAPPAAAGLEVGPPDGAARAGGRGGSRACCRRSRATAGSRTISIGSRSIAARRPGKQAGDVQVVARQRIRRDALAGHGRQYRPRRSSRGFEPGQWIELTDDATRSGSRRDADAHHAARRRRADRDATPRSGAPASKPESPPLGSGGQ